MISQLLKYTIFLLWSFAGTKPRSSSLLSNSSLDDVITTEMAKAKSEAEKRRSLQPKPVKPPSPVKPLLPPTASLHDKSTMTHNSNSESTAHISSNGAITSSTKPGRPVSKPAIKPVSKPVRPPVSAQLSARRSVDPQTLPITSSPYDKINQPYESRFEWKDEK